MAEHLPVHGPARLGQLHELRTALRESQKQGHEEHAENDPGALRRGDRLHPRLHAEDEPAGDRHDVDDGDALEPQAVEEVQDEKGDDQPAGCGREHEGEGEPGAGEHARLGQRSGRRQPSRRDRTAALHGVRAILLAVDHVIERVDGTRGETKGGEDENGEQDGAHVAKIPREDERREADEVLGPLPRARDADQVLEDAATRGCAGPGNVAHDRCFNAHRTPCLTALR